MIRQTVVMIPAALAVWCVNCNNVSNSPGEICVCCDSVGGLLNISRALAEPELTPCQPIALEN